ncbi:DUF1398 family protein, partial [Streptococcus suis]
AINHGHEQFTGPDFPKLIAYFKDLGMVENTVDIQSGQVVYRSKSGQVLEKAGYQVSVPVAEQFDQEQFVTILRNHQAGQTDFPTFCQETAEAGIYKWGLDLKNYIDLDKVLFFLKSQLWNAEKNNLISRC